MMFQPMKLQVASVNRSKLSVGMLLILATFTSCSRCEDCELAGNTERLCETEFDSQDQYENAIDDREASGATCTPVSF